MTSDYDGIDEQTVETPDDGVHLAGQSMRELRRQVFDLIDDVNDELYAVAADENHVPDLRTLLIGIGALAELVVRRFELREAQVGD